jgi:cell division protein FtsW
MEKKEVLPRRTRAREKKEKKPQNRLARWLFFLPLMLAVGGLFFVFEASSIRSLHESGSSFYYLIKQGIWLVIGIGLMVFFSFFDYKKLYYASLFLMSATVILLIFVLIPGIGSRVAGASRWINIGPFTLQPTEFAKLSTIIYLASWFSIPERKRFFSFMVLLCVLMALIMLQPDMGTAIIIFCLSIVIYFLAGRELRYLLLFLPAAFAGALVLIKIEPYRFKRYLAFIDPNADPQGITYHINQILISLANGGIFGQGFGASRQKYLFLPEAHTDSIFAIVGEEIGFIGCIGLIVAFMILIYLLYRVSSNAPDRFGKLLSGGIFAFFGFQVIINLCGMVKLMPLTGVPLPFISYGGSNMLISFTLIGIAVNIAKKTKILE